MRITANGIGFNCRIDGPDGAPPLLLSNSLATNLSMWDPQVEALQRSFRVVRYDQRGHGGTDAPVGRYTFATLIADAVAVLDALGIARAHVGGVSMGGATALGLAELHPGRVDRVVVCCTPAKSTPASTRQWEDRIRIATDGGMEALVEPTLARWFPAEVLAARPPHVEAVRAMIRATPRHGFIGCAAALADHDFAGAVATVLQPVLFVAGERDGANPAAMRDLHARLRGSRYVEIEGAGHICNLDRPEEFTGAVRDFLQA